MLNFLFLFLGWILFVTAVMNIVGEITDLLKDSKEEWHSWAGRIWSGIRLVCAAGCLSGWQLLVF